MGALLEHVVESVQPATWLPVAHVGLPGDRVALCGAPVLGISAFMESELCDPCEARWSRMGWYARYRFRHRRRVSR